MSHRNLLCLMGSLLFPASVWAQMFTSGVWEQRNLLTMKASQLFYEANVGINVRPQCRQADFVYVAFGYGNPTRKNAWRKFIPENNIPDGVSKSLREKLASADTDDLHAGKVAVGWNHWFSHTLGFYAQAGWGFLADLSTGDDLTSEEKAMLSDSKEKSTFIYNTVPVELGLTLNLWQHWHLQGGVTYMWKEIPLLTVGVGYAF